MTGLVLVTHPGIASALLEQARQILSQPLESVALAEIGVKDATAVQQLAQALAMAEQEQGTLVMVDLPCATPANLALEMIGENCRIVSGLNLPMLIRACNYRDRSLSELCDMVMQGAQTGIKELT